MESRLDAIFFLNQLVSVAFIVDMGINFNLAYVDRNTFELVQDERRIRWHYLSTMWFWLDLVSVIDDFGHLLYAEMDYRCVSLLTAP